MKPDQYQSKKSFDLMGQLAHNFLPLLGWPVFKGLGKCGREARVCVYVAQVVNLRT